MSPLLMLFNQPSGGGAPSWTPADLTFIAGRLRNWWHFADSPTIAANSDGSGGTPAVGDPVGYVASAATESTYNNTQSNGAIKPIAASDSIQFTPGSHYFIDSVSSFSPGTTGMTIAARVKYASDSLLGVYFQIGGQDNGQINAASVYGSDVRAGNDVGSGVTYDASSLDWSAYHTLIAVWDAATGKINVYLDSDTVTDSATVSLSGSVSRDLVYGLNSASVDCFIRGRFLAAQAFSGSDIAHLRAWLER